MEKKRCNICGVDVSGNNWSRHVRSKKHTVCSAPSAPEQFLRYCNVCDSDIVDTEWLLHTKTSGHKKNAELFLQKIQKTRLCTYCNVCGGKYFKLNHLNHLMS